MSTIKKQHRIGKAIAPGVVQVTHAQGPVKLLRAKIEGTQIEENADGTFVIRLPDGTPPGEGGLNYLEDADGTFEVVCIMPE